MNYDSESRRQRQHERMAEIRAEYQRVQRYRESRISASMRRHARAAWSHMRWPAPRRAPVSRA